MLRSLIRETRQSAAKQERHICICLGLWTTSQNKSLAKKRACVCVRLPLWVMKGNNRAEREAPCYNIHSHSTWKLKSWRWVKGGRSLSLQCKLATAEVLKTDIMRSFHVCTFFFLATIMTNLSNICTIRRRAGHSWIGCKANLRREKLKK